MRPRTKFLLLATPLALILLSPIVLFGLWMLVAGANNGGSPQLAAEWREELEQFDTPEQATSANPDTDHIRFQNGDWFIGLCRDSHGLWRRGGGTMVTRDSNGRTRAFFGHVCGAGFLQTFQSCEDLEAFDRWIDESRFTEHMLP